MEHNEDNCRDPRKAEIGEALGYAAARRDDPALVSAAEAYFGSWGNALYAAGIDPSLYLCRKWRKRTMPAKRDRLSYGNYLARLCPRCNGYLGIVLREPGRNVPVRAVNGHCLKCGHRLAWIIISGKQAGCYQSRKKRYAEPAKNT